MSFGLPSPAEMPLWQVVAAFAAAAALVWLAGTRLAHAAEGIARRFGLTRAFVGMALLGLTTSLPEVSTVATAGVQGHPRLAVTNLLGGVALQVVVLALADFFLRRRALTSATPDARVLLQGVVCVLALGVAVLGLVVGDPFAVGWVGAFPLLLGVGYLAAAYVMQKGDVPWHPEGKKVEAVRRQADREGARDAPVWRLVASFAGAALLTVAAGVVVTLTAESIGARTGLGENVAGSALVALSTSLPEISTVVAAVRMGSPTLAASNVFGTNVADVALLLVADAFWTGGLVMAEAGAFSIGLAALGILLTCVYLVGLLERRDRRVGRLGVDSLVVVVAYAVGYALLFRIR